MKFPYVYLLEMKPIICQKNLLHPFLKKGLNNNKPIFNY